MNTPAPITANASLPSRVGKDEISLLELLDVVLDNRWLIAAVTVLGLVLGVAYALLATPVYRASTMVQVEESKGGAGTLLGDAASLFDIRSPASAEMQILRSRLVLGQTVQNMGLDVEVTPRYVPVFGRWLARYASEPSDPGFLMLSGYVSGNESLRVDGFDVPEALEGERFRVRLTAQGYELLSPDNERLGGQRIGQALAFSVAGEQGLLLVSAAVGKPGAEFNLRRHVRLEVIERLQKALVIAEEGKQSGVIRASLEGEDPREIARVLNEIGSLYVRQNVERKVAEADKSLGFLSTFLPELRRQLEAAETKFSQFRNRNSSFDLDTEGKLILEQAIKLQTSVVELQQKRKELLALYTAEHYTIRTIDARIAGLQGELKGLDRRVKTLPDVEQELLSLTRDVKVNSELYVKLLDNAQQLRLVKEGKVANVRIVDPAAVPRKPAKPLRALSVLLATTLGLMLGLAVAFVRNGLRPGLKDPAEIEQCAGLHVFATVPHTDAQAKLVRETSKSAARRPLLATANPHDAVVESLRSFRTALQFTMLDSAINIIVISGPTPGVGKSFVSANLAAVLGATDKKVLLIDGDLRKGRLNHAIGVNRRQGLSEVICGSLQWDKALHREIAANVDFLSTGVLPPNSAELLTKPSVQVLLQQAARHYDWVIVDTPPVLAASDTAILAPMAGAVFLVARAEVSTQGELQESTKRLLGAGVTVNGVIFNDLDMTKRRYGGSKYGAYRFVDYQY
ncbi:MULTISPECIES: polysaccharide biosynthesis tyrosine autokinase [unclassified Variovorax]|uniref:polysaccharide biosynthesis tyrosine autokinase n=1 Tax=unclassified Variovorax TaxID=663243 RepID=UPI00076CDC08|nr:MULTISPECIES: polysaccharide biosynthesis tyrosine autokinase [unclassified Variovorax]KWT69029.1 Tyrosine-protein kinase Wzc [Variovorax sp. WDL1]PNG51530.1 Tyrosine-protein kinase etk [Variovorax sp. B2]PNG54444.1 Tyrosine-protein kinase etk [Variovorax sp. B4]VTV11949.1 Tyrosine-protein kinase etk [Variovorax sp. WDL1]